MPHLDARRGAVLGLTQTDGGRREPAGAPARCGAYLDHLTVERGAGRQHAVGSYRRDLDRYLGVLAAAGVTDLGRRRRRGEVAAYLAALREGDGGRIRRWPRRRRPGPSARCAGCTGSRYARASPPHDPGREVKPPTPPKRLPKALRRRRGRRGCSAAHGGDRRPAARCATGRCWSSSTAPAPASPRRSAPAVDDLDLADGTVLLHGKGGKTRLVPVGGYARDALDAYLVRARPALVAGRSGHARGVPQRPRRRAVPAERVDDPAPRGRARPGCVDGARSLAAHAAPLVRHPSARRRRRRPGGAGAARARLGDDDAGLHAGHRRPAARGVRHRAPAGPG